MWPLGFIQVVADLIESVGMTRRENQQCVGMLLKYFVPRFEDQKLFAGHRARGDKDGRALSLLKTRFEHPREISHLRGPRVELEIARHANALRVRDELRKRSESLSVWA